MRMKRLKSLANYLIHVYQTVVVCYECLRIYASQTGGGWAFSWLIVVPLIIWLNSHVPPILYFVSYFLRK